MQYSTAPSWQEAREKLRKWREQNERKSDEIVDLWMTSLGSKVSKAGDEKWMIIEQVAIAALDVHNYGVADDLILKLKERFPDSDRVRFLQVLRLQALQRYDDALKGLDAMIQRDNTNSGAYKQKVAILKCQGKNTEAIKELADYLNKFMSDQEGWSELCDLYLAESDYARAAFCAEEMILHNPHNYFVHQRLADIRYTMGGIENTKFASSHYSQALKLNPESMRAYCGLFLSGSSLATNPRVPATEKREYSQIASWAAKEISTRYGENQPPSSNSAEMLEGLFGALQIQ
ncbi:unnamed protein product [Allacma fusca]|uniref:ER membrane protein complex subunit 2 n=1 Tax=Allacma fusca TaxID=39272 RepID=A0A8J2LLP0_9HEXA|nr:unnamed protein product [Allacma fusca]